LAAQVAIECDTAFAFCLRQKSDPLR
ncbi:hypothetical protein D030_4234B, partial [Vibrio parahaemolyticus AQ3810]